MSCKRAADALKSASRERKRTRLSESDAQRRAGPVSVEIVQNGDGYEVHPTAWGGGQPHQHRLGDSGPQKATVTRRNEKRDITGLTWPRLSLSRSTSGDVEVRDSSSDVPLKY
jgi:hypothetical protein